MISIVIATFGDDWLAEHQFEIGRAKASAVGQAFRNVEVVRVHDETLHEARNLGAHRAKGSILVFLDADDWLDKQFCTTLLVVADVLQPQTAYFNGPYQVRAPHYIEPREHLYEGNHLIVGCPVKRELFLDVGGFHDWPLYEDWELWLRMEKAGATFGKTRGIYNIDVSGYGRNQDPRGPETYDQIRSLYT